MDYFDEYIIKLRTLDQAWESGERYLNPVDINVPVGYTAEIYAFGLNYPINMVFTENGDLLIAESGYPSGTGRILRLHDNDFSVVAEDFNSPVTGVNYKDGNIYVSHRGVITLILPDGTRRDIISGLPSNGDFGNNKVEFGPDGKLYFGQGSATNSGVVGTDNLWVKKYPLLCDHSGKYVLLNGQNFETDNMLLDDETLEKVATGAFSPFGVPNQQYEVRKGEVKATGSILRVNPNGTDLEMFAWGIRNAIRLKFDPSGRLYAANHGFDERGSRPIANASDHMYIINQGVWYGWPDYTAGEPVTSTRFIPEGGKPVEFLFVNHPNSAPQPFAKFPPNSTIMGFDINNNESFGKIGDIFIAEFGSLWPVRPVYSQPNPGAGHKISRVDAFTGGVTTFAINKSGFPASLTMEGGFGWPTDVVFGPDGAMYVLDFGTNPRGDLEDFLPDTGTIWRITRTG